MEINDKDLKEILDHVYDNLNDRILQNALDLQDKAKNKWPEVNEKEFEWIEKGYSIGVADGIKAFGETLKEAIEEIQNKHDI